MPAVVGVAFSRPGKTYYFDPGTLDLAVGESVIVKTTNGSDLGEVLTAPHHISEEDLAAPLKPVIRRATTDDLERAERSRSRESEILTATARKIDAAKLPMKLVSADVSYDGSRVTVFFSSESRVDFRQLVRDLSSELKARIELRQVGVRDAARQCGGCGPCGQELCCSRFLTDFAPVSVRMAKDQDLPLNPSKISGTCGRLLCCLRYEHDAYLDFYKRAPKRGATMNTESGCCRVADLRPPKEALVLQYEDGTRTEVKLADLAELTSSQTAGGLPGQQAGPRPQSLSRESAASRPQGGARSDSGNDRSGRPSGSSRPRNDRSQTERQSPPMAVSGESVAGQPASTESPDGGAAAPKRRRKRRRSGRRNTETTS